jgi:mannosyltransferase
MYSATAQSAPPSRLAALRGFWRQHTIHLASSLLLLIGLAVRLYRLGAQSLWLDEGGTWAVVIGQTWGRLIADLGSTDAAYPLYHLLLKGWVGLAGDSEWALRFPSALAGALAVVAIFFAALELETDQRRATKDQVLPPHSVVGSPSSVLHPSSFILRPTIAALLFAVAPFALWHAQDAKVYSVLVLCATLQLWALLRALRTGTRRDWLLLLVLAFTSVFVHRLAILGIVGLLIAVALVRPYGRRMQDHLPINLANRLIRGALLLGAGAGAGAAIYGVVRAVGVESRGGTGHIPAGPLAGLWLTLAHFALDRGNIGGWLGVPLLVWALPALVLTCWGLARLTHDAWRGQPAAIAILCLFAVPLLLFAIALGFVRLFEARYVTVAFPAWILVLVYPLQPRKRTDQHLEKLGTKKTSRRAIGFSILNSQFSILTLFAAIVLVDAAVLFQPEHGLFSGAPVKEQWREGIAEIARRAHPDDLLIVHPYYVQPMWAYYAPRVTPDPLPQITTYNVLGQGHCLAEAQKDPSKIPLECYRRVYEQDFNQDAAGHKRMLMLLAPDHARTIDPPKTVAELIEDWKKLPPETRGDAPTQPDRYGLLGLRFQYSQRTWPCGDTNDALIGVEVMCASFPSFYRQTGPDSIPQPQVKLVAEFGGELGLRGYTISPAGGALRPGGTLPITLYWAATVDHPMRDYTMFLHLCRDCAMPPLAQFDRPPLDGFYPAGQTSTWRLGDPVHDERAIPLIDPNGNPLAPGRYTLLLGIYPAGLAAPQLTDRLQVSSATGEVRGGTRLVLGEVIIGQ